MKYYIIEQEWKQDSEEYPYCQLFEVGNDFYTTRVIDKFKDGRICFASEKIERGTFLPPIPLDNIEVYNYEDSSVIVKGYEISKEDFLKEWSIVEGMTLEAYHKIVW